MSRGVTGIIWAGPVADIGGFGNVTRNYLKALQRLGLPIAIFNTAGSVDQEIGADTLEWLRDLHNTDIGDRPTLIVHGSPTNAVRVTHPQAAKRICITIFETDRIPADWVDPCNMVDEVWVPSAFNLETFSSSGVDRSKLKVVPYAIDTAKYNPRVTAPPFPFSGARGFKFLYTFAFDYRKGVDLLLQAFCNEFRDSDDVTLVLKIYQPSWSRDVDIMAQLDEWMPAGDSNPDVLVILEKIPHDKLLSLYQSCDVYVSTDRANGWGMPCMEMMAMGKPAITIDWSGSTAFMNETNAFLIPPSGRLEPVHPSLQAKRPAEYAGHLWASVNVEQVQQALRRAYEDKAMRERVARQAAQDMQDQFSIEAISRRLAEALGL